MKIISNFKDYYDKTLMYGADDSIKYIRLTKDVPLNYNTLKEYMGLQDMWRRRMPIDYSTYTSDNYTKSKIRVTYTEETFYIGFCGRIYFGVKVTLSENDKGQSYISKCFYSYNLYNEYMLDQRLHTPKKERKKSKYMSTGYLEYDFTVGYPRFEKYANTFFQEYNVPTFIITKADLTHTDDKIKLVLNPNLSMYEFIKVIDPVQALQELSMYVGGVLLQPTNPMVDISNEDMLRKKGFDEWSFRKKGTNSQ